MKQKKLSLQEMHAEALQEFGEIQSAQRDERQQCLSDRRFYSISGAAWEGALAEQFANKPKFEINKTHLSVIRIFNEYRNNRITVDFVSKDGSENDKLAETCDSLYRADEQDSTAEEAYDNAFEEAVGGGFGAWRYRLEEEDELDEENDKRRIKIEPIYDADSSVFFDLNAKRQDKSDAKSCYVLSSMTKRAYEAEYDDSPDSWPKDVQSTEFDWSTPDTVFVCEYYKVEIESEKVYVYSMLDGTEERYDDDDFDEDEDLKARLSATGAKLIGTKTKKCRKVRKLILSGGGVLEDCGHIAGKHIPIVPVYGKRWYIDGVERCMGHVRLAKDPSRLKNMQLSKLAEISALSSVEKPILTPEQIAGHTLMWSDDNIKDYPYLLINPITDAMGQSMPSGPLAYTRAPNIPPTMAALMQITEQDLSDVLGNQQAGEQLQANTSGRAVELIQSRLDMQVFIYMSNLAKAMKRGGDIWQSMAAEAYVEQGRKMKVVAAQGEVSQIELKRPVIGENGAVELENDLSKMKFDVVATVGPSSSSKRAAAVRGITGMMSLTQDPETQQVLGAMAMMNMEGEGIADARVYFRKKLLRMGVVKPSDKEAAELMQEAQNQPPDDNAKYLQAAAEEATANATKARADTVLTIAKAEETKAKTVKTLSDIDASEQAQALEMIDRLAPQATTQPAQ